MELIVPLDDFAINSSIIIAIVAKLVKCFFVPFSRNRGFIKRFVCLSFSKFLYIIAAIAKNNISLLRVNLLSAIKP
jgi:hypothetical protein